NIDCRLRLWIDNKPLALGDAANYSPATPATFDANDVKREGWIEKNDIDAPASIGATLGVTVSQLKIFRDTYTIGGFEMRSQNYASTSDVTAAVHTYYVQPGHTLCFGDNSAQSSDGRDWGVVPDRLMLGKAMFIFAPLDRIGFIR
ncbi:MAG: S26 family signal peptidase, partial [Gemmataceae bacterium]